MSRTAKVFVSCAAGAGIGTLVALELNTYLWWIGLLAGALVGYLSYEFKKVIMAITVAWKEVTKWRPDPDYWHPDPEYWKTYITESFYSFALLSNFFLPIGVGLAIDKSIEEGQRTTWFAAYIGAWLFVSIVNGFNCMDRYSQWQSQSEKIKRRQDNLRMALRVHLFAVLFYWLPFGLVKLPKLLIITSRFLWHLFRLIHSEIRLLCAVDSAIGAFVGYAFGSVLIGMIAGGLIGLANYEIISKRWLKLVPVNENAS